MLIALSQNKDRSIEIIAGRFAFKKDIHAASQMIDGAVRARLGEYKYNQTKGIQYVDNVFSNSPNLQKFESQVRSNVLSMPFVESIQSFDYNINYDNFELSYLMVVKTEFGIVTVGA